MFRDKVCGVERSFFCTLREFRGGGEEDIAGAVERGFAGIFEDADDEAYADAQMIDRACKVCVWL